MAIPKIKATYALDADSIRALERMARRQGISKSEALRRAIRLAADQTEAEPEDALAALDRLQESLALGEEAARRWARSVRSERVAASSRREARRR
jgi:hypothetical protein